MPGYQQKNKCYKKHYGVFSTLEFLSQPERVAEEEKAEVSFGLMTLNFFLARSIQSMKKSLIFVLASSKKKMKLLPKVWFIILPFFAL